MITALQAIYALGRLGLFYKSSSAKHYALLTAASAVHFACYSFIKLQAGQFDRNATHAAQNGRKQYAYSISFCAHCCLCTQVSLTYLHDAEPAYENGELIHGGSDLALKGSLPYYAVEVIYSLALLQVLTVFSDKLWWLLLGVRSHALCPLVHTTCIQHCHVQHALKSGMYNMHSVTACATCIQ